MGNYKLFNNRFVSVRSLCNQSNVQLNFVRLAKWEISFGEFCYIQMAFVRWTGIQIRIVDLVHNAGEGGRPRSALPLFVGR